MNSTPHAFEPEEVMAYLDGELEARQAAALASHLEHCSECGVLAIRLRQISERMLDFQVEPCHPGLEEPIAAALRSGERERPAEWKLENELKRRRMRRFAWAAGSIAAVLLAGAISVSQLMRSKWGVKPSKELAVSQASETVAIASPGAAPDSNGLFHGLGHQAANSFSVDGHPMADQPGKVFSEQIEAPELRGPMIVETASVTLLASNYDQASGSIERVTAQHRGYIQAMTTDTRTGMARSVSATLRVPDRQLEAFLADLQKVGHVEQETRNNQEVTNQFVDLTARLRTARATEQRIIELLGTRTGKLSDVLDAERELARIRGEIESMDGQRANMEHQVRYATVQVQLNEEYREPLNPQAFSSGMRVRNSMVEGLRNLASGVVSLLIFLFAYGPSILFWLALFAGPAWFTWRHYRREKVA
jgi:Domain of unknown function (DUF4349)/Putative zinc-finger